MEIKIESLDDVKKLFCCNGKCHKPELGETKLEKAATILAIILFFLSCFELYAYAVIINTFRSGSSESCCGIIDQLSYDPIPGAVCSESDFGETYPKIGKAKINGSMYCVVNGVTCDQYFDPVSNQNMTLNDCFQYSSYEVSDICSSQEISMEQSGDDVSLYVCYLTVLFILVTTAIFILEFFGCFRGVEKCEKPGAAASMKGKEVVIWALITFYGFIFIENTLGNGYNVTNFDTQSDEPHDAYSYMETNCNIQFTGLGGSDTETDSIIWTDFDLDIPAWLQSDVFNAIGIIGLLLSVIDFALFAVNYWCDKMKENGKSEKEETNEQMEIELKTQQSGQKNVQSESEYDGTVAGSE